MVINEYFAGYETGEGIYISRLSFKALEDTGHYYINYDDIPHFISPTASSGCAALDTICNISEHPDFYCNSSGSDSCHWSSLFFTMC